ncbi:DUF2062 domain-containing protein [Denitromonas iodatirespirans]|uniref:DUF2062 domain-containing protein n=1 Tax=Denitromonas iodatirespirans TaxID=2795389 RepID=A0A944DRW7_DENI1|nr:DUF2062 domain-containing protein [Denitromonas iodatirespirans]MBT0963409.1 DUF2062 domain-containing protein [Denitromonas iodatirespirans]
MRKFLRRFLPDHASVHNNRWLRPLQSTLLHPSLWHLNRHSAAGAVAVGLYCGLIPGPFQMLGAALGCVVFRVNLPLALVSTLYTNPFTIVPLYFLAYTLGNALVGGGSTFVPPPEFGGMSMGEWLTALTAWITGLGYPLLVGLLLLANGLALTGYFAVRAAWRWYLVRAWRARQRKRAAAKDKGATGA